MGALIRRLKWQLGPVLLLASLCAAPQASAAKSMREIAVALPAAGDLTVPRVVARAKPSTSAAEVLVLHQFRSDFRHQEVLAVASTRTAGGKLWYKLNLPMRPNGTTGWVAANQVSVHPVRKRILVNIHARRLEVLQGNKILFKATVAVGAPGMPTPVGHFYVQVRFIPDDPFLGIFALETSAYSSLTEWPGGGVVGIHGTDEPQLIGEAVSHGCVRVTNASAAMLRKLVPVGTPITIIQGN